MRYCSTWLRSLLCYIKKFVIEEFVIRVFHCTCTQHHTVMNSLCIFVNAAHFVIASLWTALFKFLICFNLIERANTIKGKSLLLSLSDRDVSLLCTHGDSKFH